MRIRQFIFSTSLPFICAAAFAQDFPVKPVRIVAAEPGGGGDFVARLIAQGLPAGLGQQVIVDNRGGTVALRAQLVVKSPPDGYTLQFVGASHWLLPFMRSNVPYDPVRDYAPITLAVSAPSVLAVHPSLPVKSVKELIALAKAKPGALNYSSGATGSPTHLAAELFKSIAGVDIVRIPYRGTSPALTDLIAGLVQVMFVSAASVTPHLKSGRLRPLAVTSPKPSMLFPGLPTVAASGAADYESVSMYGVCAPAGTPGVIINRLNQEIVRVLNMPDSKAKLLATGIEVIGSSPEQFAAAMQSEMNRMGKLIKAAGIREE